MPRHMITAFNAQKPCYTTFDLYSKFCNRVLYFAFVFFHLCFVFDFCICIYSIGIFVFQTLLPIPRNLDMPHLLVRPASSARPLTFTLVAVNKVVLSLNCGNCVKLFVERDIYIFEPTKERQMFINREGIDHRIVSIFNDIRF